VRRAEQLLDDPREAVAWQLPEILGEHRPDALQDEVAPFVGPAAAALGQAPAELGDHPRGVARDRRVASDEHRLAAGQEQQRVVAIGQLDELERRPRAAREATGLPHLEAVKGAQHDVRRRGDAAIGIGGALPVAKRLRAVASQVPRLARRLHLEDADARPEEVYEAALLAHFHLGADRAACAAVALEQVVEKGLRLRALAALVQAPARRERREAGADLLAGQRHRRTRLRPRAAPARRPRRTSTA